jgi:hypothetical protein
MEGNTAPNGASAQAANAEAQQAVDATANEPASEVNARLLAESKKNKTLAQELKQKLAKYEAAENSAMQEQQRFKELYEKSEAARQSLFKTVIKEKIKSSVADKALKAGCVDVDGLIKLGNAELLRYDEESLEVHGVDTFVEEAMKSKPYLFQSAKTPTINPATPGGTVRSNNKSLKELSKEEILSQLRALG